MHKKRLHIIVCNHFDTMWRRCFDRPLHNNGKTYLSYADIQEFYILDNLALANQYPFYKFNVESVAVMKKFLERHPESYPALQKLINEHRLYIPGSGHNIIDSNMVLGESIARNFLFGNLWLQDTFGYVPKLCIRNDAFGNSAQMPQILRQCGFRWVDGISYVPCENQYWRGLDGTCIVNGGLPAAAYSGGWTKLAPCPVCKGKKHKNGIPCSACNGRGYDIEKAEKNRTLISLNPSIFDTCDEAAVFVGGEEIPPSEHPIQWAEQHRKDYDIVFSVLDDYMENFSSALDQVDHPDERFVFKKSDLNPTSSATYVTRIKTKQICRRQEYALLAAESLNSMTAVTGKQYPREKLNHIWDKLLFTMFHDAITGTHVDAAYHELETDFYPFIDLNTTRLTAMAGKSLSLPRKNTVSLINPTSLLFSGPVTFSTRRATPVTLIDANGQDCVAERHCENDRQYLTVCLRSLQPFAAQTFRIVPLVDPIAPHLEYNDQLAGNKIPTGNILSNQIEQDDDRQQSEVLHIENERFKVTADHMGILGIYDKVLGRNICSSGEYRPAELIIEHDEGSPWARLSPHTERLPLAPYTNLLYRETAEQYQRFMFHTELPFFMGYAQEGLSAEYSVTLYQDSERIDFRLDAFWNHFNHRLRIAFPTDCDGIHRYEIPFGHVIREEYEPILNWAGNNGDWPAVNWCAVESEDLTVALLNQGIPSYKVEKRDGKDTIFLSVLRSPVIPTYLHEVNSYSMTDWNGMRDQGNHTFEYALTAYARPVTKNSLVTDAYLYLCRPICISGQAVLPTMPTLLSEHAYLSAVKMAEKENALILRIVEFHGVSGTSVLCIPNWAVCAFQVNIMEQQAEPLFVFDGKVEIALHAFEIATIKIPLA